MEFDKISALVVEDHALQREIAVQILTDLSLRDVSEAGDGTEALQIISEKKDRFDVILCDLQMPGMDGVKFIRHIAENGLTSAIILASSLEAPLISSVETMANAHGLNVLGALEKPLRPESIKRLLEGYNGPPPKAGPILSPTFEVSIEDIERGIAEDEFIPFFQPKVSLENRALLGVEALMRWKHSSLGMISPGVFIPLAENSGLIDPLTEQMMDKVTTCLKRWIDAGVDLTVSVNISMASLGDVDLPDRLAEMALRNGVDPAHLILEITETAVMSDVAHSLDSLVRLRMKGFGLSVDDFGTGYSSMQQLSDIPFTELKIDQVFVTGVMNEPGHRSILETSIDLAGKLGLKTVAEGIETQDEWDLIRSLGCDQAQGYFVSRPLPEGELAQWMAEWEG